MSHPQVGRLKLLLSDDEYLRTSPIPGKHESKHSLDYNTYCANQLPLQQQVLGNNCASPTGSSQLCHGGEQLKQQASNISHAYPG